MEVVNKYSQRVIHTYTKHNYIQHEAHNARVLSLLT